MIYELRTYTIASGQMEKYLKVVEGPELELLREHGLKIVGFWTTERDGVEQAVHLWVFADEADRQAKWASYYADPRRDEVVKDIVAVVLKKESLVLTPVRFSEMQ